MEREDDDMKNTTTDRKPQLIYNLLPAGKANAVPAKELCASLGLDDRRLRICITRERENGAPIISTFSGRGGYYRPADQKELDEYYNTTRKRALRTLSLLKGVQRARNEWNQEPIKAINHDIPEK